ncbi:MAG: hypothetical protein PHD72_00400 [Patescibacteria group bacterium]|nr:hypothetical protein [Patescibacteria group bacterium]
MFFKKKLSPTYLVKNISIVLGLVLVWRGLWYALDWVDMRFLGGSHVWSALGGIILGLILLYIPDKDFRNIERL